MKSLFRSALLGLLIPLNTLAVNVSLRVAPSTSVIGPGQGTFVDLTGTVDGVDRLLGGAVFLDFRADLLEVVTVTLRAPSDIAGTTGTVTIDGTGGRVGIIGFATFAGVVGSFDLATVEFRARQAVGVSPLIASDAGDPVFAWASASLEPVTVLSGQGQIAIAAVPEPGSAAMWFAGLLAIGGLPLAGRIRRQRSA